MVNYAQSRPGRRAASCDIGVVGNPISRRGASNQRWPRDTQQVRCKANGTSTHTVGEAWAETAHANSRKQNVVEMKNAKPNVFIVPSQLVGEVGLALSAHKVSAIGRQPATIEEINCTLG